MRGKGGAEGGSLAHDKGYYHSCLGRTRRNFQGHGSLLNHVPGGMYHVSMPSFRMLVKVLAVMHALFAGFTALVGAFANGGDIWQRLLVVLLHPLGAAGVLVLVLRPRLVTTTILALAALLTVNVVADLGLAQLMAAGRVRGDWELALAFSVVPVIGVVYALALLRTARRTTG